MSATPEGFKGIFYSQKTGSDNIFDMGPFYPKYLKGLRDDALFLSVGAYVDVLINDYPELAESILATTKELWPDLDWEKKTARLEDCFNLARSKPDNWRKSVYAIVEEEFLPSSRFIPESLEGYFFDDMGVYDTLFKLRGLVVKLLKEAGHGPGIPIFAWLDCYLNEELELADEIKEAIQHFYPDQDWEKLREVASFAQEEKEKGNPDLGPAVFEKLVEIYKPETPKFRVIPVKGKPPLVG